MKPRTVFVTSEIVTDAPLSAIKSHYATLSRIVSDGIDGGSGQMYESTVRTVNTSVAQPAPAKRQRDKRRKL